jgi:hypothetical protein
LDSNEVVPYFDSDKWAHFVENFSLPIILRENMNIPTNFNNPYLFESKNKIELWQILNGFIGLSCGLPLHVQDDSLIQEIIDLVEKNGVITNEFQVE